MSTHEVVKRSFDKKWIVWSFLSIKGLNEEPFSKTHVPFKWVITGVFETNERSKAITFAKDFFFETIED